LVDQLGVSPVAVGPGCHAHLTSTFERFASVKWVFSPTGANSLFWPPWRLLRRVVGLTRP